MKPDRYGTRRARRESERERRLLGETLDAFHRRENAPPPTLAEIYATNKRPRDRCRATGDLFDLFAFGRVRG